jgi:hypothetical protein
MSTMKLVCRWFHAPRVVRIEECDPTLDGKENDTICEECMKRLDEEDPIYQRNMRTIKKTRFNLGSAFHLLPYNKKAND